MALINNNAPKFETEDAAGDTVTDTVSVTAAEASQPTAAERFAAAAAKEAAAKAATPANTAVAAVKPAAVAVVNVMSHNPFTALDKALPVQYDTLKQIMVTQGQVMTREDKESLGDYVGLEILSHQDHWVVSPGGDASDDESKAYLKYSDDGKTERDSGRPLAEFVQIAIDAGYPKAKIVHRKYLVGSLFYPGKDKKGNLMSELQDELVQIDLAPRSKKAFEAYQANAAFKAMRGLLDPQSAVRVCMGAKAVSENKLNWTDATFRAWNPETDGK